MISILCMALRLGRSGVYDPHYKVRPANYDGYKCPAKWNTTAISFLFPGLQHRSEKFSRLAIGVIRYLRKYWDSRGDGAFVYYTVRKSEGRTPVLHKLTTTNFPRIRKTANEKHRLYLRIRRKGECLGFRERNLQQDVENYTMRRLIIPTPHQIKYD